MSDEKIQGGFEYLGPQSEYNQELPRRFKVSEQPVEGAEPIENFGNVELHFTWPELERIEKVTPDDDAWAGKDYPATRSEG